MPKGNGVLAKENRIMINAVKGDIKDIKKDIGNIYTKIDKSYNHLSARLPTWATTLFMVLTAILGGLLARALF